MLNNNKISGIYILTHTVIYKWLIAEFLAKVQLVQNQLGDKSFINNRVCQYVNTTDLIVIEHYIEKIEGTKVVIRCR
jgi:hypothetical protein